MAAEPKRQRILLISLFHPELVRGGAQQICYELFEGLQQRDDVDVFLLASIDSSLPALYKSGARITGFDGRPNEYLFLSRDYDYGWHRTANPMLHESFAEFLLQIQPDVVHFHHFLTLGVDMLSLTRKTLPDCRLVFTFHEFLAICAADGHMWRTMDKSLCDHASPVRCHQCFPAQAPEDFFMREMWMKRHLSVVDVFTTPSRFMIEQYLRWGIDLAKIVHVSNGQRNYNDAPVIEERRAKRNRFAFFGQLVDAKGVHVILQAVQQLRADGFDDFTVEINGDNLRYASEQRRADFESFMAEEADRPLQDRNVIFNGSYHVDQLAVRMARVDWCIVPSVWWEIFGLVISEAWMFKRPVIASNVGGPKERIRHDVDGLHFQLGDARDLARMMYRAATEEGLWDRLSAALPEPPSRNNMVAGYLQIYGSPSPSPLASPTAAE